MTFPTVKSDPYKRRLRRPRSAFTLWTSSEWDGLSRAIIEHPKLWLPGVCWLNWRHYGHEPIGVSKLEMELAASALFGKRRSNNEKASERRRYVDDLERARA